MITLRETFNITVDELPFTYSFTLNNSCINYEEVALSDTQLIVDFTFSTESCLQNANVTLNIRDNNGCIKTKAVVFEDTCNTLALTDISLSSNFTASTLASGGTAPYTYYWTFDENTFSLNPASNPNSGTISLLLDATPETTTIGCTVIDANGCTANKELNYTFVRPVVGNVILQLAGIPNNISISACPLACNFKANVSLPITGDYIDYDTVNIVNSDPKICIVKNGDNNYTFYSSYSNITYISFTYTVKNVYGIESLPGTINLNIPACKNILPYITSSPSITTVPSGAIITDVITIPLAAKTLSTNSLDWTTFAVSNSLDYGTTTLNANAEIEYTLTSVPTSGAEIIVWRVEDTEGNTSGNNYEIINFNLAAAPVITAEIVCAACNEPSDATDILANDTGDINPATVTFTFIDDDIAISGSNGTYIFTPGYGASFTNIISYTVANYDGIVSDPGNIAVRSVCAGQSTQDPIDITCLSRVIELEDYIQNHNSSTYTITETSTGYESNGGTYNTTPPAFAELDFTGIPDGTYTFEIEGTNASPCSNTNTLTMNVTVATVSDPSNDLCAGATALTFSDLVVKNNQTNLNNCPVTGAPTDSGETPPASWAGSSSGDLWYTFTCTDAANLTPYIYMKGGTVASTQIALYSGSCGTLVLEADKASLTSEVSLDSSDYTTLVLATQYWLRVSTVSGDEGTFKIIISKNPIS
jgi:hypothetical protein